jgi:hemolysin III
MTSKPVFRINKEPVSWATHCAGLVAAIVGLVYLVIYSAHDTAKVAAMSVYGGSLVVLFFASTVYHFFDLGPRRNSWLRRFDHVGIFLLIVGSYVPAVIHLLDGVWRISILALVGGLALAGAVFRMWWIDPPEWLGTGIYLTLGWIGLIPAYKIMPQLEFSSAALLLAGGLSYTVGAFVFAREWPDPWPKVFGHHEIWHVFVLAGAGCYFFFVWDLMAVPVPGF